MITRKNERERERKAHFRLGPAQLVHRADSGKKIKSKNRKEDISRTEEEQDKTGRREQKNGASNGKIERERVQSKRRLDQTGEYEEREACELVEHLT